MSGAIASCFDDDDDDDDDDRSMELQTRMAVEGGNTTRELVGMLLPRNFKNLFLLEQQRQKEKC